MSPPWFAGLAHDFEADFAILSVKPDDAKQQTFFPAPSVMTFWARESCRKMSANIGAGKMIAIIPGRYGFAAQVDLMEGANARFDMELLLNGSPLSDPIGTAVRTETANSIEHAQLAVPGVTMEPGDYLQVRCWSDNVAGATMDILWAQAVAWRAGG
jgi:hypothetical protein